MVVETLDNGFSPDNIRINQGDTIKFINKGSNYHWPASNIHPTHQIYPGFDPKKELKSGESWEFKFEKYGSWRFHDHDWPSFTGTIVVNRVSGYQTRPDFGKLFAMFKTRIDSIKYKIFPQQIEKELAGSNIPDIAKNNPDKLHRLIQFLGPEKVLKKLLADTNQGSGSDCHQPSHAIGRISYEIYKAEAFKMSQSSCQSGFLHGVMEAFLSDKGTDNLAKKIDNLCSSFETSFSKFECLHGVGHGVMAYEDENLPEALKICTSLGDSFSQNSCYGGIFMENILTALGLGAGTGHKTDWVSEDPYFPCNKIDQDPGIQNQCYLMQTSVMLRSYKYDFSKVVTACGGVPELYRNTCFQSLGRDAAGFTLNDPDRINKICLQSPADFYQTCLLGGLYVIMDFWGENLGSHPKLLCDAAQPFAKEFCYRSIGVRLSQFFGNDTGKMKQVCDYSENNYIKTCLSAAGI